MLKKITLLLFTILFITLIGIYFAIKNPITHVGFKVVVDSKSASLSSISPNGAVSKIQDKTKNNQIDFAFGDIKSHLRNVAYFVLTVDIATLNNVSVYRNDNDKLIASYNKEEFLSAWKKTTKGYQSPPNIRIAKSLLPKINKVINWHGDQYLILVVLIFYLVCAVLAGSIWFLKTNFTYISPTITSLKSYYHSNKKTLLKYFIINYLIITVCYIGISFVNRPFADDFARINDKNGWTQDARYLVHFIYQFFTMHLSRAIYVATPYTYFVGTAFLSLASLTLALLFNRKNIYISIVISSLLAIAPFYWEAIIFRHEILIMSVSVFYAILFTLFSWQINYFKSSVIFNFLGLFIIFFSYQTVILHYILLLSFFFLYEISVNKKSYKTVFTKILAGVLGLASSAIFYKLIDRFFLTMDKITYAQTTSSIASLDLNYVASRLRTIANMIIDHWQNTSFGVATLVVLIWFIVLVSYYLIKAKLPKPLYLLALLALIVMLFSPFLIFMVTSINLYSRFFMAINLLIAIALLFVYNHSSHKYLHRLSLALVTCLVLSCFSMASLLANRLQRQQEHEVQISAFLQDDLYQYKKVYNTTENIYFQNTKNIVKIFEDKNQKPLFMVMYNLIQQHSNFITNKLSGYKKLKSKNSSVDFSKEPYIVFTDRVYYNFYYYPRVNEAVIYFK